MRDLRIYVISTKNKNKPDDDNFSGGGATTLESIGMAMLVI